MTMTRRQFLQETTRSISGLVLLTAVPTVLRAQHWANCQSGKQVVPFTQLNSTTKIARFSDWHEGDCEMQGASLTLQSNGTGVFQSQVCTHFTHSKDIWHFYVELAVDQNSSKLLTSYSWDGPKMSEQDQPLYHPWKANFRIPTGVFASARYARATSCC